MEQKRIKLKDLVQNTGQIEGLPANPRQWTRDELDKLKDSITETPELLEARGIIVYPHNGRFVAMGGNMRLAALTEMGEKDAPCIVLPADTTIDKLKEIVIKDNGAFGKHDWDALANEWSDLPLTDWGIPAWDMDAISDEDKENYTRKIKAPDYEPSEKEAKLEELIDEEKCNKLIEEINGSGCNEEVKDFLRKAAQRHRVFDFAKIADYFARADKETQSLMIRSALVIVDFDNAIKDGFVILSKKIEDILKEQEERGDDEA